MTTGLAASWRVTHSWRAFWTAASSAETVADAAVVVVLVVVDGVLLGLLVVLVVGSGEAWLALSVAGQDAETEERRSRDGEQGDDPEDERQRRSPLRTVFSHVQPFLPMRR